MPQSARFSGKQSVEFSRAAIRPLELRPGIIVRVAGIYAADEILGQAIFRLHAVKGLKWRRRDNPAKIEDYSIEGHVFP